MTRVFVFYFASLAMLGVASCAEKVDPPPLTVAEPATPAASVKPSAPEAGATAMNLTRVGSGGEVVSECGAATMTLQCTTRSTQCDASALWFQSAASPRAAAPTPKGMDRFAPVGLACATSKNGGRYFLVQYGELPAGCKFCEWFHLYDSSGKPLTGSDPAVLKVAGQDSAHAQAANNEEFEALAKSLELDEPDIQFLN